MPQNTSTSGEEALPKVSVITVVLNLIKNNRVEVFKKCIESVCCQTYPNIEHIIIDGSSTDGTQNLLEQMGLSYVSEKDNGIYEAMNKGAARATGSYLIFMNSDDCFYEAHSVEKAVRLFLTTGADAVCGNSATVYENGSIKKRTNDIGRLLYRMSLCHQAFYCTKKVFDALGGFDETYRIAGDYDFIFKMVLHKNLLVKENSVLCFFRAGGESTKHKELIDAEIRRLIDKNYQSCGMLLSQREIHLLRLYCFLSPFRYCKVRTFIHPQMRPLFDKSYCKVFLQALRRFVITIHLNKRYKEIRLLGMCLLYKKH